MKGRKKKTSKLFLQNYQIPSFLVLSVNNSITAHFGGFFVLFFLPSPMAPDGRRTAGALGMVRCLGGGNVPQTPAGIDEGFLKGRFGRTTFVENERFISVPFSVI